MPVPFLRIFPDDVIAFAAPAIHAARFGFGIRTEPGQLGRAERAHFRVPQRRHHRADVAVTQMNLPVTDDRRFRSGNRP